MRTLPALTFMLHLAATAPVEAQSPADLRAAIDRLDAPTLDVAALELLIDAGEPAAKLLVDRLQPALANPTHIQFPRILRALRAIGPDAAVSCGPIGNMLFDPLLVGNARATGLRHELARTLVELIQHAPGSAAAAIEALGPNPLQALMSLGAGDPARGFRLIHRLNHAVAEAADDAPALALDAGNLLDRALATERCGSREDLPRLSALLTASDHPSTMSIVLPQPGGGSSFAAHLPQERANHIVHDAASLAIARIDPAHPAAIRGLVSLLQRGDDPRDRRRAALALGQHGPAAEDAVPALITALADDDLRLVGEAVTALGMIGVASAEVMERLELLTRDQQPAIAARARAALASLRRVRR